MNEDSRNGFPCLLGEGLASGFPIGYSFLEKKKIRKDLHD
jgi:hypothetical protein